MQINNNISSPNFNALKITHACAFAFYIYSHYNKIMKKIICLLFSLILFAQSVYAVKASVAAESRKTLNKSTAVLRSVCQNVQKGLKHEYHFLNFFNYECSTYNAKRLRVKNAFFPIVNNVTKGYNESYRKSSSEFIVNMDKKQLEYYKWLVENYCE